ncbi:reverse transcriptase domain-containing protein, partial [Trichonephila clavipes]
PIETPELILKEFADVFTGTGRLKNSKESKIKRKLCSTSWQHPAVPLAIHKKVKERLSNMVSGHNKSKVEGRPTEWVSSSMVVIDSPKKLRICLDPRPLNEAIQDLVTKSPLQMH